VSVLSEFSQAESAATPCATSNESNAGRAVLESFISKFKGRIYPVNSSYDEILGL
jgi:acyl-CoA synthetase (NDP forming)